MPFIGSHYRRMNKQILVIGESHYFDTECNAHDDAEAWYHKLTAKDLKDDERAWTHTRNTAGSGVNQSYSSRAFVIFRNIEHGLREALVQQELPTDNYFRYAAFYNYFQRPAKTGVSIVNKPIDDDTAYSHLMKLQKVIGATHLAFVSKRAYTSFLKQFNRKELPVLDTFATAHPSCSWWNRVHRHYHYDQVEKMTSREWFVKRIGKLHLTDEA